ncbi:MAG TPA: hypothetical protein VF884_16050 [Nitrososphaeraceae archaeon]
MKTYGSIFSSSSLKLEYGNPYHHVYMTIPHQQETQLLNYVPSFYERLALADLQNFSRKQDM